MKAYTAVLALKLCDPLVIPGHGKVNYQQAKVNYRPHRQVDSESSFCLVLPEIKYILFDTKCIPTVKVIQLAPWNRVLLEKLNGS